MPELWPEDVREPIPIPLKPLVPAIPTDNENCGNWGKIFGLWAVRVYSPSPGTFKTRTC